MARAQAGSPGPGLGHARSPSWDPRVQLEPKPAFLSRLEPSSVSTRDGPRNARLVAIHETRKRIFRFAFLTPPAVASRMAEDFQRTTFSFRRLSPEEAKAIRPLRLRFTVVADGDTAASLAARMPFEKFSLEWFETLNGLQRGDTLAAGSMVKMVGY